MINKKIFTKKKSSNINKYSLFYFLFFLILLIIIYFFFYRDRNNFFDIKQFSELYYIIPEDKGGKKIINQDKKGLHLSYEDNEAFLSKNNTDLKFSIQLFTADNYHLVNTKRTELLSYDEIIFYPNDLFVSILKNDLGTEYFLLYKNFDDRKKALTYCKKYTYFVNNCIIVNVQNFD